jgi:tryptophan 2,3-dioxygenase
MQHLNVAIKYIEHSGKVLEATGGSDWKKYMHPNTSEGYFFQSYGALRNWQIGCRNLS